MRGKVIATLNRALASAGLVLCELGAEPEREQQDRLKDGYADAARRAWGQAVVAWEETRRLRLCLLELDELLGGVGYSSPAQAARRVVDVALRRSERAAA